MAERTNIPTSPACGQWETLLADALDGLLRPEDEATFSNHMATCWPARHCLRKRGAAASGWIFYPLSPRCRPDCWTEFWRRRAPGRRPG